jgi:hypothetical protein
MGEGSRHEPHRSGVQLLGYTLAEVLTTPAYYLEPTAPPLPEVK